MLNKGKVRNEWFCLIICFLNVFCDKYINWFIIVLKKVYVIFRCILF